MARAARDDTSARPGPPHAVVAEDDPLTALLLAAVLGDAGLRLSRAPEGGQALAILRRDPADLLVTDLDMPGMGGRALALAARALAPRLPVLIVSASADIRAVAAEVGAAALPKPFDPRRLAGLAASLLAPAGPGACP